LEGDGEGGIGGWNEGLSRDGKTGEDADDLLLYPSFFEVNLSLPRI
jgi:hypothetical protein